MTEGAKGRRSEGMTKGELECWRGDAFGATQGKLQELREPGAEAT